MRNRWFTCPVHCVPVPEAARPGQGAAAGRRTQPWKL